MTRLENWLSKTLTCLNFANFDLFDLKLGTQH